MFVVLTVCLVLGLVGAAFRGGPFMFQAAARQATQSLLGQLFPHMRVKMVSEQIESRDVRDPAVLNAMRTVPRHEFIPVENREDAYGDHPVPIGCGQTISQPYIVAAMTELANVGPHSRVLEIGTGSGYQSAVLAEICAHVWSVEIVPELAERARWNLERLGYSNVSIRVGDGHEGWLGEAPFDAIIVTAAPETVPLPLMEQLKQSGRLVIPVGTGIQDLRVITRTRRKFTSEIIFPVRFVPMIGMALEVY